MGDHKFRCLKILWSLYKDEKYIFFNKRLKLQTMSQIKENEDRIQFYLGNAFLDMVHQMTNNSMKTTDVIPSRDMFKPISQSMSEVKKESLREYYRHLLQVVSRVSRNPGDVKVCMFPGDIGHRVRPWELVKNRGPEFNIYDDTNEEDRMIRQHGGSGVILKSLNAVRHWTPMEIVHDRYEWKQKKNAVVWRGVTTGSRTRPGNRFELMNRWYNADPTKIDVGFIAVVQNAKVSESTLKRSMPAAEMCSYKYILSVEGNDKDSGLNWKLTTKSVVFMPRPRVVSWLMKSTLEPFVHYVPIEDDFSDLQEKLEWCQAHESECLQIVKNANEYMRKFYDTENEIYIENEVMRRYLDFLYNNIFDDSSWS